jgi:hypothetical protein
VNVEVVELPYLIVLEPATDIVSCKLAFPRVIVWVSYAGRNSDVPAFVATTWQVPADDEVSESMFEIEQLAGFELVSEKLTVPVSLPPLVVNLRSVRYVPEVEVREKAA